MSGRTSSVLLGRFIKREVIKEFEAGKFEASHLEGQLNNILIQNKVKGK